LSFYLCDYCKRSLKGQDLGALIPDIEKMLAKEWLGAPTDLSSAAAITSALGHDLFIVKGLRPTFSESIRVTLRQEGVRQILAMSTTIVSAVLITVVLVLLGLRT
jgi:hypothetical protein